VKTSLKLAFKGFLLCVAPTLFLLSALYFVGSIYLIDTRIGELAHPIRFSAVSVQTAIREDALWVTRQGAILLVLMFMIYWLLAGAMGLKRGLGAPVANALLLAGSVGFGFLIVNRFFYWIEGYCDQRPFPHNGFQLLKIDECPSSATFLLALMALSIALFILSLGVRTLHSYRRQR
jgi:hypothetical protein